MLEDYFKPEERSRGHDLLSATVVSSRSDTAIRAYIKTVKVSLRAANIASPLVQAECSCPSAQLCKHIWAVILKLDGSDFLESKSEIERNSGSSPAVKTTALKERQADFRKRAYAKQKVRAKEMRANNRRAQTSPAYPSEVEEARSYFSQNGFALEPLDLAELLNAKKLLSRVFHPDKGGTHEETVTLNRHFEILHEYLKS